MVLLGTVAIAVALVPMVFAYLQLGYHGDVVGPDPDRGRQAERALQGAVVDATADISTTYRWSRRSPAVSTVRSRLAPALDSLNSSSVASGTAYGVSYNATTATQWVADNCPMGPNRQFGTCEADRGVVVQNRANATHVLAVAVDVRVTTRTSDAEIRMVVRPFGDE